MMNGITMRSIVIDTDAGLDDAYAIFMALAAKNVNIVAITTVMGNTGALQVGKNVLRLLKLADRLDIPVFVGCDKALNGYVVEGCAGYHGSDGFGDCPDPDAPDPSLVQKEDGVSALIRLSKEHNDLNIICLGPLTNVATVVQKDKGFGDRIQECFIMGGNYYGKGNMTVSSEYNFYVDPEAAREVLLHLTCPKTLIGWEVCTDNPFSWDWYQRFLQKKTTKAQFLAKLENYAINKYYIPKINQGIEQSYEMADQFIMAVAMDSNVCKESKLVYADVELKGELTRGQMVVDWRNSTRNTPNVKIVTKIDQSLAELMVTSALDS